MLNQKGLRLKDLKSNSINIADLEDDIADLKELVLLNTLENATQSLTVLDSAGLARTKAGFLVDNFQDYTFSAEDRLEYRAAVEPLDGVLRPLAIGNEIKRNHPDKYVFYVASEKFTNQFIDALKSNSLQEFIAYYRNVDVLMLDDVQFLKNKEKTQEIFFHIFNHLHQCGKQIIMTSDRPTKDLSGLQERLVSRFKWGLTADIQQPDLETRIAIIRKKLQADGILISDQVIEYLAYSVNTNIRELEGVIISMIAHASLTNVEVDLELAKTILKNIVSHIDSEVGVDYIQKTVGEYFNISIDDMKAKTRKKEVVIARQVAMHFAKDYTNHSLKSIGYHFGGRDHSTVIYALQSVSDMIDTNSKFKYAMEELKKKIKLKTI